MASERKFEARGYDHDKSWTTWNKCFFFSAYHFQVGDEKLGEFILMFHHGRHAERHGMRRPLSDLGG